MMDERDNAEKTTALARKMPQQRAEWLAPEIRRTRAGEAEAGVNPIVNEGAFAFGS